jgi:acyl carrier protein
MKSGYVEEIKNFLSKKYKNSKSIKESDPLFEKGIIDSFGVVELVSFLESKFGVVFDSVDLTRDNFLNIKSISRIVEKKRRRNERIHKKRVS